MVSISGTGPTADRPLSVVGYGHNVLSSKFELVENVFIIERQYQNGWVLSRKIRLLLSIRISRKRTRLSSHLNE